MDTIKLEDKSICKKCGICCKKCGCDYSTENFEDLSTNHLKEQLEKGDISIVSYLNFTKRGSNTYASPFLYLRARNINRPIVDLLSLKTTCSKLGKNGCEYDLEHRPKGGVNLIPLENQKCYSLEDPMKIVLTWKQYQTVLRRLVKSFTGDTVENRLKKDAYQLFIDLFLEHYERVSRLEILDVLNMLPHLASVYSEEFIRAKKETSSFEYKVYKLKK